MVRGVECCFRLCNFLTEKKLKTTHQLFAVFMLIISSVAYGQDTEAGRWPGAGHIGVRAGLGGSTATPGIDVGNVGIKVIATENIAVSIDLGLRIFTASFGSYADFGLDAAGSFYLGDSSKNLRPYIPVVVGLGVVGGNAAGRGAGTFQLAIGGGFGAEYFFSRNFSLAADLVLRIGFQSFNPLAVEIRTLTPGVHATYYF